MHVSAAVWGGTPAIGGPTDVIVAEADLEAAWEVLRASPD
jgi:hypothetical protein